VRSSFLKSQSSASSSQSVPGQPPNEKKRKLVVEDDDEEGVAKKTQKENTSDNATPTQTKEIMPTPTEVTTVSESAKKDLSAEMVIEEDLVMNGIKWEKGQATPFAAVCATFEAIEATTKRYLISHVLMYIHA
jgi:DNA ligase 1